MVISADLLWVQILVDTEIENGSNEEIDPQKHKSKEKITKHVFNRNILILGTQHVKNVKSVFLFKIWKRVNDQKCHFE